MKVLNVVDDFCTVEINGVKKSCFIGFLERKPEEGEYLLVHAGMAIKILDYQSAQEIIDELALLIDGELRDSE